MQPINQLFADLALQGVTFWIDGDELRFRGPPDSTNLPAFVALRQRKKEALAFLDAYCVAKALPPIANAERPARIPLSRAQKAIWDLAVKRSLNDQVTIRVPLSNPPQVEMRTRGLNRVVQRHEILRTVYREDARGVEQVVLGEAPVTISVTDLSHHPAEIAKDMFEGGLESEFRSRRIDPGAGPMLLAHLFVLSSDASVLLVTFHCLALDLPSRAILLGEFAAFCRAERDRSQPKIEPLPLQFADFVLWEQSNLKPVDALAFWRMRLAGVIAAEVANAAAAATPPHAAAIKQISIPNTTTTAILQAAIKNGVDPSLILITASMALISDWTGHARTAASLLVSARPPGTEKLIGPFARLQPIALDMFPNTTFSDALQQIREGYLAAANPARMIDPHDLDAIGLDRVVLDIRRTPLDASAMELVQPKTIWQDMFVSMRISPTGVFGGLYYADNRVDETRVSWFAQEMARILPFCCARPDALLHKLIQQPS